MPTNKQLLTYAQAFAKGLKENSPSVTIATSGLMFRSSLRTGGPAIGKMLKGRSVTRQEARAAASVIFNGAYIVSANVARARRDLDTPPPPSSVFGEPSLFNRATSDKVDPFANMVGIMKGFFDER
jgi:hypothetical protein